MNITEIYFKFANLLSTLGYKVKILRVYTDKESKYLIFYNQIDPIIFVLESSKTFSIDEFISNPYDLYFHLGYLNSVNEAMYCMYFEYSQNFINEILSFIEEYKNKFDLLNAPLKTLQEWKEKHNLTFIF